MDPDDWGTSYPCFGVRLKLFFSLTVLALASSVFAQAEPAQDVSDRVSLFFGGGSSYLHPAQAEKLQGFLEEHPDISAYNLEVQGHTDDIGDRTYNLRLSAARAQVVLERLLAYPIPRASIDVLPLGEDAPSFDNATWEGKLSNRRVDVMLRRVVL